MVNSFDEVEDATGPDGHRLFILRNANEVGIGELKLTDALGTSADRAHKWFRHSVRKSQFASQPHRVALEVKHVGTVRLVPISNRWFAWRFALEATALNDLDNVETFAESC